MLRLLSCNLYCRSTVDSYQSFVGMYYLSSEHNHMPGAVNQIYIHNETWTGTGDASDVARDVMDIKRAKRGTDQVRVSK
jgi:hypothetical protein